MGNRTHRNNQQGGCERPKERGMSVKHHSVVRAINRNVTADANASEIVRIPVLLEQGYQRSRLGSERLQAGAGRPAATRVFLKR